MEPHAIQRSDQRTSMFGEHTCRKYEIHRNDTPEILRLAPEFSPVPSRESANQTAKSRTGIVFDKAAVRTFPEIFLTD